MPGGEALREPVGGLGAAAGLGGTWGRHWLAAGCSSSASSKNELLALPWEDGEGVSGHRYHSQGTLQA